LNRPITIFRKEQGIIAIFTTFLSGFDKLA